MLLIYKKGDPNIKTENCLWRNFDAPAKEHCTIYLTYEENDYRTSTEYNIQLWIAFIYFEKAFNSLEILNVTSVALWLPQ